VRLPPGAENAGKPGYYTVKAGDTLIRIGFDAGCGWKELASINSLDNPNLIEVGQVLKLCPQSEAAAVVARPVVTPRGDRPLAARPAGTGAAGSPPGNAPSAAAPSQAAGSAASAGTGAPSATVAAGSAATPTVAGAATSASGTGTEARQGEEPVWSWPAAGPVIGQYEEGKQKGLLIGGKAGDPVLASADGKVVYAGSVLRGYGNLVILKHSGDFLTAYAHNQTLLVKEDQVVKRGQKIAEMGSTEADRVQLHFEIRKKGKPLDPARQLPAR
jgi:lipoprotein NlpD